jgi:hypothetical protein
MYKKIILLCLGLALPSILGAAMPSPQQLVRPSIIDALQKDSLKKLRQFNKFLRRSPDLAPLQVRQFLETQEAIAEEEGCGLQLELEYQHPVTNSKTSFFIQRSIDGTSPSVPQLKHILYFITGVLPQHQHIKDSEVHSSVTEKDCKLHLTRSKAFLTDLTPKPALQPASALPQLLPVPEVSAIVATPLTPPISPAHPSLLSRLSEHHTGIAIAIGTGIALWKLWQHKDALRDHVKRLLQRPAPQTLEPCKLAANLVTG